MRISTKSENQESEGGIKKTRKFGSKKDGDEGSSKDGGDRKMNWKKRDRPPLDLIMDYKDIESLKPFLSEGGRIIPARVSRLNSKQQKELTSQIKRARQLALIPISDRHQMVK